MAGVRPDSARQRIEFLEREVETLANRIDSLITANIGPRQPVRLAKTTLSSGQYPSDPANVYPIMFLDGGFTELPGNQTPSLTNRSAVSPRVAFSLSDSYIALDTLVVTWRQNGKYWCLPAGTAGDPSGGGTITIQQATYRWFWTPNGIQPFDTTTEREKPILFSKDSGYKMGAITGMTEYAVSQPFAGWDEFDIPAGEYLIDMHWTFRVGNLSGFTVIDYDPATDDFHRLWQGIRVLLQYSTNGGASWIGWKPTYLSGLVVNSEGAGGVGNDGHYSFSYSDRIDTATEMGGGGVRIRWLGTLNTDSGSIGAQGLTLLDGVFKIQAI